MSDAEKLVLFIGLGVAAFYGYVYWQFSTSIWGPNTSPENQL